MHEQPLQEVTDDVRAICKEDKEIFHPWCLTDRYTNRCHRFTRERSCFLAGNLSHRFIDDDGHIRLLMKTVIGSTPSAPEAWKKLMNEPRRMMGGERA